MIKFDTVFKNVLREVGMLEALIGCLASFAEDVKEEKKQNNAAIVDKADNDEDDSGNAVFSRKKSNDRQFGEAVIAALTELISGNQQNATVYRDSGGVAILLLLADIPSCRETAIRYHPYIT